MDTNDLRATVARHATSASALVALGFALNARMTGIALEGDVAARTEAVLSELGVSDIIAKSDISTLAPVLASIRADLLFGGKLLSGPLEGSGWHHREQGLLQAFGDVSSGFPGLLKRSIAPELAGLVERLEAPGAAFLDIGIGVGSLSIAMLRQWPNLSIVGVEPLASAVALAKANVSAAGLEDRIEVRTGSGEDIADADAFDLIFVPSAFIPEMQVRKILRRAKTALKPGGWLLLAAMHPGPDRLVAALARFRTTIWGGTVFDDGAAVRLLNDSGYADARLLPGPAAAAFAFAAGRRKP